jgi:4'-phosphopantetheinyl transferase EntD
VTARADNPARLSKPLGKLFAAGAVAAELTGEAPRAVLTADELRFIEHCADKRIDDFSRGRACARRALQELGLKDFSVLAGSRRQPLWPQGIVGSITHTAGYAAAVVARRDTLESIGLDCEQIDSVDEEVWPTILTPSELAELNRVPPELQRRRAALAFAAKEAFYKLQFPLTGAWVGFEDVQVSVSDWNASSGGLQLSPRSELPLDAARMRALAARFEFRDHWVIAGISLPVS